MIHPYFPSGSKDYTPILILTKCFKEVGIRFHFFILSMPFWITTPKLHSNDLKILNKIVFQDWNTVEYQSPFTFWCTCFIHKFHSPWWEMSFPRTQMASNHTKRTTEILKWLLPKAQIPPPSESKLYYENTHVKIHLAFRVHLCISKRYCIVRSSPLI